MVVNDDLVESGNDEVDSSTGLDSRLVRCNQVVVECCR